MSELEIQCRKNLKVIRETLDTDIIDVDINSVTNKAYMLTQLSGTAAECKGIARKLLEEARLRNLISIQKEDLPASMLSKKLEAMCANEHGLYEYADRINASISNTLDTLRTTISLYKTELENMNKGNQFNT